MLVAEDCIGPGDGGLAEPGLGRMSMQQSRSAMGVCIDRRPIGTVPV
jgi:hypothetical protein